VRVKIYNEYSRFDSYLDRKFKIQKSKCKIAIKNLKSGKSGVGSGLYPEPDILRTEIEE